MKKIVFIASECVPFIKTGGLADVVGSLPKNFDANEYDIRVIIPNYQCIKPEYKAQMTDVTNFYMDGEVYVGIKTLEYEGIHYYFIDNEHYFSGDVPYYDLFQDIERFAYFSKAALSSLKAIDFKPDIIHCHDWQAALVPVYVNTVFKGDAFYWGIRTIMTVHNLRFQGKWNTAHIQGVSKLPDECFQPGRLVHELQDMSVAREHREANLLRGGLVYSDYITTVSNTYAREIQTPFYGEGLDGLLAGRSNRLWGIVNGIDTSVYDPANDDALPHCYTISNFRTMKKKNKRELQESLGLEVNEKKFTIAIISRLTDQKGLDLVDYIMDRICSPGDIQFVVLGTGDQRYEDMFRWYQGKYPESVSANIYYSDELSHRIYGSVDAMLVPSHFEPCGLTQLMALRYGTVPIVRETGGLVDTVEPYNMFEQTGTGFSFANYNGDELFDQIQAAKNLYYNDRAKWNKLVARGMQADWSWNNSARIYKQLYDEILSI